MATKRVMKKEPTYDFSEYRTSELREVLKCIDVVEQSGIAIPAKAIEAIAAEMNLRPQAIACTIGTDRYTFTEIFTADELKPADARGFYDPILATGVEIIERLEGGHHFLGVWLKELLADETRMAPWMEVYEDIYLEITLVEEDECECEDDDEDFDEDDEDDEDEDDDEE